MAASPAVLSPSSNSCQAIHRDTTPTRPPARHLQVHFHFLFPYKEASFLISMAGAGEPFYVRY